MTTVITKVTFTTTGAVGVVRILLQRPAFLQGMEHFHWLTILLSDFNAKTNGDSNCIISALTPDFVLLKGIQNQLVYYHLYVHFNLKLWRLV